MLAGSSPHTRGTHPVGLVLLGRRRFIPAYAGNALPSCGSMRRQTVHPRIRGERPVVVQAATGADGSSPHTRGTPAIGWRLARAGRFIPAYAGNA